MRRSRTTGWAWTAAAALGVAAVVGCANNQKSGIDPTGNYIFEREPYFLQGPDSCPCPSPCQGGGVPAAQRGPTFGGAAPVASTPAAPAPRQSPLEVRVQGPQQAVVGDDIRFDVTVTNRGPASATNLRIEDRLDPGLQHKATGEGGVIKHELRDLAAGQSQQLKVVLRATQPGQLCQTIEVSGPNVGSASHRTCLTVAAAGGPGALTMPSRSAPPGLPAASPVTVTVSGPQRQSVGEQAQFAIDVTNNGSVPLRGLKLLFRWDAGLMPSFATDGYGIEQGSLAWKIDELPAGKTTRRDVHCACQSATARSCSRATVTLSDGGRAEGEACMEIRVPATTPTPTLSRKPMPPALPGEGLTLSAIGLRNPVAAGNEVSYEIRVGNRGTALCQQVAIRVVAPDELVPQGDGASGPAGAKATIQQQTVQFDPVAELRPGDTLVYHVRVRTKRAGKFRIRVEATVPGMTRPLAEEASTDVF